MRSGSAVSATMVSSIRCNTSELIPREKDVGICSCNRFVLKVHMSLVGIWLSCSEHLDCGALLEVVQRRSMSSRCRATVADICWKMAIEGSESGGSSDGGGRSEQQRCRLRLRCDFVAASGVGCSEGAAVIGGRQGSGVHDCCGGGQRRYGARDRCWSCSIRC
ncbi:hypothetical protein BHM03_00014587 [Ensete ventricosum]|nr:hypothetical protein BHM03_00014587 [Ensete ventricosum]